MTDVPERASDQAAVATTDDALLDSALRDSDTLLADSLRADQRRRRTRLVLFLVFGGVVMSLITAAIMAGWLTASTVTAAERQEATTLAQAGWTLWGQGQMDGAEYKFEQAVELNPEAEHAWNGLGWARFNQGNPAGATEAFKSCLELSPKHTGALNGLGQTYLFDGDLQQAEHYLLKAAPEASAAWWGLARLYLLQGKFDKALPFARKIVDATPDDRWAPQMVTAAEQGELSVELRDVLAIPGVDIKGAPAAAAGDDKTPGPVGEAMERLRQTLVLFDLSFDQVLSDDLARYDPDRLEFFPVATAWPDGLGMFHTDAASFRTYTGDMRQHDSQSTNGVLFEEPLAEPVVAAKNYKTLLFSQGVAAGGAVVIDTYAAVYCRGDMAGMINSQSYATIVIDGDMTGMLRNASYGHWVITGDFSGSFQQESAGTLRVLGKFTGQLHLGSNGARSSKVVLAGRVDEAQLKSMAGQGTVYVDESDLGDGEHDVNDLRVIVGKRPRPDKPPADAGDE